MRRRGSHGFTLVELITIIVILGILAVVALPRMNAAMSFRSVEFRDQVIAALRYAQKTATSHRHLVCATLAANTVTLTIDHDKSGACDGAPNNVLNLPGRNSNVLTSSGDGLSSVPAGALFFQPDGRVTSDAAGSETAIANFDAAVEGGGSVVVRGATGYVGDGS